MSTTLDDNECPARPLVAAPAPKASEPTGWETPPPATLTYGELLCERTYFFAFGLLLGYAFAVVR